MKTLTPGDPRHGTPNGYVNYGCRCESCKAAASVAQKRIKAALRSRPIPSYVHGTVNGYKTYKCKCDACRAAHRATYKPVSAPSPRRALERAKTEAMHADYLAGMSVKQVADKYGYTPSAVYSRFRRTGLPRREPVKQTAAMYVDYCTGMTVDEVAERWGKSRTAVYLQFRQSGLPLRPRKGRAMPQVWVPAGVTFEESNTARAAAAGERRAAEAQAALNHVVYGIHRQVLELRITYPQKSLAELGALCDPPMTKDAYASHLRRALANAEAVSV